MMVVVGVQSTPSMQGGLGACPPQDNFKIRFQEIEFEFGGIFGGLSCHVIKH